MNLTNNVTLAALVVVSLLLAGCTVNPQELGAYGAERANSGQARTQNQAGAGNVSQNGKPGGAETEVIAALQLADVARHNSKTDCWVVIGDAVLDISGFVSHPGGDTYVPYCGTNATAAFNSKGGGAGHSDYAKTWTNEFRIGTVGKPINETNGAQNASAGTSVNITGTAGNTSSSNASGLNPEGVNNSSRWVVLSPSEVAKHNGASDCWIIFGSGVYDLSGFASHPGGSAYVPYCGGDGSAAYASVGHSANADALRAYYRLGSLYEQVNVSGIRVNDTSNIKPPKRETEEDEDDCEDEEGDD